MYPELDAELSRNGLDKKKLSEMTGIQYSTLLNKINGRTEFTKSDMCKIRKAIAPHMTLDQLFSERS